MQIFVNLIIALISLSSFSLYGSKNSKEMKEAIQTPKYLYKILPSHLWHLTQDTKTVMLSSDDALFIHLSKEDQLEKISAKFFSDSNQFVVLKIDASKLEGKLVYELNPGGSTKYYHLYKGSIPFNSIVEAKIIYPCSERSDAKTLQIEQAGSKVLRQLARRLTKEEILSPEIQKLILDMKAAMKEAGVGLAAPQIGKPIQLAVIEDMDHSHLSAKEISERERNKVPFHVIINPILYIEEEEKAEFFEGCLSVPNFLGIVPRAKAVRVECLNEKGERVEIKARGWYARILQHEIDHLNGILYIDRAYLPTLLTEENYFKEWRGKSIQEVKDALNVKKPLDE